MDKRTQKHFLTIGVAILGVFAVRYAFGKVKQSSGANNAIENKTINPNAWHYPQGALPYAYEFEKAQRAYNLPMHLLEAVAERESNFDVNAVGAVGEQGIMQIRPDIHPVDSYDGVYRTDFWQFWKDEANFFYADTAIDYAAWYLRHLFNSLERVEKANGHKMGSVANWANVLVCYNWGIGNFLEYLKGKKNIPIQSRDYANTITRKIGIAGLK